MVGMVVRFEMGLMMRWMRWVVLLESLAIVCLG